MSEPWCEAPGGAPLRVSRAECVATRVAAFFFACARLEQLAHLNLNACKVFHDAFHHRPLSLFEVGKFIKTLVTRILIKLSYHIPGLDRVQPIPGLNTFPNHLRQI